MQGPAHDSVTEVSNRSPMPAIKQIYAVKKVRFRSDYYSFANVRIERPRSNWFRNDNPDNCQSEQF